MKDHEYFIKDSSGITFQDLYLYEGLVKLNQKFYEFLSQKNQEVSASFDILRADANKISVKDQSTILIDVARLLEAFLSDLFQIEEQNSVLQKQHNDLHKIYFVRREFVQRVIAKKFTAAPKGIVRSLILSELEIFCHEVDDVEKHLAEKIFFLLKKEKNLSVAEAKEFERLSFYTALALFDPETKSFHKNGALFILPQKVDHQNLVKIPQTNSTCSAFRDGFDLTDKGFSLSRSLVETNYCIFCHNQGKDSCRSGVKEKNSPEFKKDPLGVEMQGCPLEEKISEMNLLKSEGFSIAALAMAVIDNPMVAGTGHRICNDCMKSCIYQKQDPVDIPQIETRTLKDVLSLPYGFEIYSLLTRWNPLNLESPLPKKPSGKRVLIAGLGPAGYTLAHYLLNDGHDVVAIDGLRIEPLNSKISGIDLLGNRQGFRPIKFLDEIYEPLSSRLIQGFGGVAEYGITARFDKNFLKIIRLLLERRSNFRMFGGVRFGSSITDKIAFETYGFDHVALCLGAGKPSIIDFKNNFAKGVRLASDFLMTLHLLGAYKKNLLSNLQIRMPILVVGGGLTAIDVACEAWAYYISQIEIFASRYQELEKAHGKEKFFSSLNEEEKEIANEFLMHFAELNDCRKSGKNVSELLKKWGGSKIIYRKKIQDAPAYRLNHTEITKALEQGVELICEVEPVEAIIDRFNTVEKLRIKNSHQEEKILECRTLLIAAGTLPNTSPVTADKLDFALNGKYFTIIDEGGNELKVSYGAKSEQFSVLTKIDPTTKKLVSFFGDLHPNFQGSVVKAMASAKRGSKQISNILFSSSEGREFDSGNFFSRINKDFLAQVESIDVLSSHVVKLVIKAPLAANQTEFGHIFRLQSYHSLEPKIGSQVMSMEGVAVTALAVDREKGLITFIVVEAGGSTSLVRNLKAREPLILMGPTGEPTEMAENENVILVGGGRGNLPLAELAKTYRKKGCKVIIFAGYLRNGYVTRQNNIEESADQVVFAIKDEEADLKLTYSQNLQFKGSVTEAMISFLTENQEKLIFKASEVNRIFAMGNDSMMAEVARIRHDELRNVLNPQHFAITSLNAPMQCMMKGVCAQCLQKRTNEETGKTEYFYSCAEQDQKMDQLDFDHLKQRCKQNSFVEKISRMWISHLKTDSQEKSFKTQL